MILKQTFFLFSIMPVQFEWTSVTQSSWLQFLGLKFQNQYKNSTLDQFKFEIWHVRVIHYDVLRIPIYHVLHTPTYNVLCTPIYNVLCIPIYHVLHTPIHNVLHILIHHVLCTPIYNVLCVPMELLETSRSAVILYLPYRRKGTSGSGNESK